MCINKFLSTLKKQGNAHVLAAPIPQWGPAAPLVSIPLLFKCRKKSNKGFTLIEILVALFIFAIVGVLAALSLHSMIRTHQHLKKTDTQILRLQMAMTLLRRDLTEVINRPVRNTSGSVDGAFIGSGGSDITFTRTGLINPFDVSQRSDMQRVGYVLQGEKFVRLTWDVLDQPPQAKPEVEVLLNDVTSLHWQFLASNKQPDNAWPPSIGSNMQVENSPLPKAVLLVMHIKGEGVIEGVFPIPARGVNVQNNSTPP